MGQEAIIMFLNTLGKHSADKYGCANKDEFMSFWKRYLGDALQKGNAKVMLKKNDRLLNSVIETDFKGLNIQSYTH